MNKLLGFLRQIPKQVWYGMLFPFAFFSLYIFWLPLQEYGFFAILTFDVGFILMMFIVLLIIGPVSIMMYIIPKYRQTSKKIIVFTMVSAIFVTPSIDLGFKIRDYEFQRLAKRSDILIDAIRKFEVDQGKFPNNLQELVPQYLEQYPQTNMAAYPNYGYSVHEKGWSLDVPCGFGLLNWDVFIYESSGDYTGINDHTTKMGKWVYVHE